MLTENDIKRAFLPFLKEFYKYRYEYRPESVHTELDNVSAGGLIADGMVSFRKEDGAPFVCTYEATSLDKAEEVKFALNSTYFMWDCLAFGAMTAAVAYAVAYAARLPWLVHLQWTGNVGFIAGMLLIGLLSWYFFLRGWRKYRYIYAIEQFKQYYADEQWIALAEDVFPAPTDPYLVELKNQCVYNGFGLALVPSKGEIRALITPSRVGIYGRDRAMVQWVTRLQWYQAMSHNVGTLSKFRPAVPGELSTAWNKIWRPAWYLVLDPVKKTFLKVFSPAEGSKDSTFKRYMRGHNVQKWVFALCLAGITPLFYRVLNVREENVLEVIEYPDANPEDQYGYLYEGDRPLARDPRAIPKQYPNSTGARPAETGIPTINLSGDNDQDDIPTIDLSGIEDEEAPAPKRDPCAGIRSRKGWIVQENTYALKSLADARVSALHQQGIPCAAAPLACLGGREGYLVSLGQTYSSEAAAFEAADNFTQALERYGLLRKQLQVLQVR
ncbi:MAG: hypothetical protein IPH12_10045 [Saprospirales bacterium]|nr:hypothetical protein [Saprospirales bacterium]MBK8922869.1 hypothetical protein [Saprospirales bacterium]